MPIEVEFIEHPVTGLVAGARVVAVCVSVESEHGVWEEALTPAEAEAFLKGVQCGANLSGSDPSAVLVSRRRGGELLLRPAPAAEPPKPEAPTTRFVVQPPPSRPPAYVLGPEGTPPKAPPLPQERVAPRWQPTPLGVERPDPSPGDPT